VDGTFPLENPSGVITSLGFLSTGTPTEPDENTYLVFDSNPGGPTQGYDYGKHFVFQGHENGSGLAYITRVNLDVTDIAHTVTLLTPPDSVTGLTSFSSIDGSTYDPFTNTLLFTQEAGSSGGVIQVTPSWPPVVNTLYGILGRGGYEGIHPDDWGNLLIIEDSGGTSVNVDPNDPNSPKVAKQPNSFVYRFLPEDPADLSLGGKLQALRVTINGTPIVFNSLDPVGDTFSAAQLALHTLGTSYPVDWVTVHDTDIDGFASFEPTPQLRRLARHRSSGQRTRSSCRVLASLPSSSIPREIRMQVRAILRRSRRAVRGDRSFALISIRTATRERFRSLS